MKDASYALLCVFVACMGMGLAASLAQGILKHLWMVFRWRVLGWQPAIYNKALVEEVSESFADEFVRRNLAEFEEDDHPPEEWILERKKEMKELANYAIQWYVNYFTLQGKPNSENTASN